MFKRNEGILDRIVRVTLGLMLTPIGLFVLGGLHGQVAGLVFTVLGAIALITGVTGICPTYNLFGIDTLNMEKQAFGRIRSMAARCRTNANTGASFTCWPRSIPAEKTSTPEQKTA